MSTINYFFQVARDSAHRIQTRGSPGDFVALIGRNSTADRGVMDAFLAHFPHPDTARDSSRVWPRVEPFELARGFEDSHLGFPEAEAMAEHAYFWLSDNARFWFYREKELFKSFPTVLLTDTGGF